MAAWAACRPNRSRRTKFISTSRTAPDDVARVKVAHSNWPFPGCKAIFDFLCKNRPMSLSLTFPAASRSFPVFPSSCYPAPAATAPIACPLHNPGAVQFPKRSRCARCAHQYLRAATPWWPPKPRLKNRMSAPPMGNTDNDGFGDSHR